MFATVDEHSRFRPDDTDTVYTSWNDLQIKSAAAGTWYCQFQYVSGPHTGGRNDDVARSLHLKPRAAEDMTQIPRLFKRKEEIPDGYEAHVTD